LLLHQRENKNLILVTSNKLDRKRQVFDSIIAWPGIALEQEAFKRSIKRYELESQINNRGESIL
jgi:hypothetical protein